MKFRFTRWLMAVGLGAAATYLLDPKQGEERRKLTAILTDQRTRSTIPAPDNKRCWWWRRHSG